MWSRRAFIKGSSLALFASTLGGVPSFLLNSVQARAALNNGISSRKKTLVCIFQRGAMDGLQAVQPLDDPFLRKLRPDLMVPSTGQNKLYALEGRFGLHPSLQPFQTLYQEGRLAIVHGIGSPVPTRSHFDAQDYMENGTPGNKGTSSGWLNRAVGALGHEPTPFQAVSMTAAKPPILYGPAYSLTVENLDDLQLNGDRDMMKKGYENLYRETSDSLIQKSGSISLDAIKILEEAKIRALQPGKGVTYPNSHLGTSLKQIAQLIKGGVGLQVAFAESNGWDTHARQTSAYGGFVKNATDLSQSIEAFWRDIEKHQGDVVVMTMTEFGRTVHQNGSRGTDHGRGSCMFVLGNEVHGGKVHGTVPELAKENLEDGRDLPVTTDFRALFSNVLRNHFDLQDASKIFPGWDANNFNIFKS